MRIFRFTLEPALKLRRRLEEQAAIELAEKERLFSEALDLREASRRRLDQHRHRRANLQDRAIDLDALLQAELYDESLVRALRQHEEQHTRAVAAVHTCRQELQRRRVDREVLERLRERRLTEHRRDVLATEQKSLDETAVLRFQRRSHTEGSN